MDVNGAQQFVFLPGAGQLRPLWMRPDRKKNFVHFEILDAEKVLRDLFGCATQERALAFGKGSVSNWYIGADEDFEDGELYLV